MQEEQDSVLFYLCSTVLTAIIALRYYLSRHFHKRISHLRNRSPQEISPEKIILAYEPNNLLFKFSNSYRAGYREVVLQKKGWQGLWARLLRLLGKEYFYRLKESKRNIASFMQALSQNQKVQLYLYTTLPMEVVEAILRSLDVLKYFPTCFRRSCQDISCQPIKHPIEVDVHTKRVLILTGNRNDHLQQDSKYFLILRRREMNLGKTFRLLQKLVKNNEEIDEFHNQVAVLKAHIQSQSQACHD